jgi:hypothetical protein
MFKKANKSHVFNTRKQKVIKDARPLKVGKSFMSMESLMALLGEIPDSDTTRTVSGYHAPDLRAKITSASVTVLAPDSPRSCNKSHTSNTTSPSKLNIGYSSSTTESSSEVMLQAKPVPRSKTVPDIFSRPTLPPAFLPSYTNERSIVSIEPIIEAQVPAYARPSMSSWYRSAANSATQGTPFGLPPAGTALRRLNGGRGNLALHHTSPRRNRSSPNALARVSNLSMTAENDDVVREQPVVGVVQAGVITTTTQAVGTLVYVADSTKSTDLPVTPLSDSNVDSEVKLWFEPEPFLPIDSDFSESEDEAEGDMAAVQMKPLSGTTTCSMSSSIPPETHSSFTYEHLKLPDKDICEEDPRVPKPHTKSATLRKISHDVGAYPINASSDSSTVVSGYSTRGSSASSHTPQSSVEFHMDNNFLGSTSFRDLCGHLHTDADGKSTREDVARAWILRVADEHSDRGSVSPGIEAPGVFFIKTSDVDKALSFHMQRRAKLGCISLLAFLKELYFDASGNTAADLLLPIFRKAAIESQDRSKVSSPASDIIRRMSIECALSSEHRGHRSRRSF